MRRACIACCDHCALDELSGRSGQEFVAGAREVALGAVASSCAVERSAVQVALDKDLGALTMPTRNQPCPCGSGLRYKQCHGAVRDAASHEQPVLPTIDDLREFETAGEAVDHARRLLAAAPNTMEAALVRGLAAKISGFPQALAKDLAAGGQSVGLLPIGPEGFEVLLVNGPSCRLEFADKPIAAIGAPFVLQEALINFFASSTMPHASIVAATVFVIAGALRGRAMPMLHETSLLTWMISDSGARSVQADVGDLLALHEVGHIYADKHGTGFTAFSMHSENESGVCEVQPFIGANSHWSMGIDPITRRQRLLLSPEDAHELHEYAPDVFALLARTVLDHQGPVGDLLQVTPVRLAIWSWVMLLTETIEDMNSGGPFMKATREAIRHSEAGSIRRSHPRSGTRADVLMFHMRQLLEQHAGPENENLVRQLEGVHASMWTEAPLKHLHLALHMAADEREDHWPEETAEFDRIFGPGMYHHLTPGIKYLCIKVLKPLAAIMVMVNQREVAPKDAQVLCVFAMLTIATELAKAPDALSQQVARFASHVERMPKFK